MRCTTEENVSQHSLEVAILAHALANIGNVYCDKNVNAEHIAVCAMYHDITEVITGDMPTPIKYANEDVNESYKQLEHVAMFSLLNDLPSKLRTVYEVYLKDIPEDYGKYVKAADKLAALIKCQEEINSGNKDFVKAYESIVNYLESMCMEEVDLFMKFYLPDFNLTIDEMK